MTLDNKDCAECKRLGQESDNRYDEFKAAEAAFKKADQEFYEHSETHRKPTTTPTVLS